LRYYKVMTKKIDNYLNDEINGVIDLLQLIKKNKYQAFKKLCNEGVKTIKNKKKIFFFGNGGSAADAQHLATELSTRFKKNRKPLPGISLATDTSAITAISNDFNFNQIFSRQLDALGDRGDLAIAITTSGNSKNLIEAAKVAKRKKIKIFSFSGNRGGKLKKFVDDTILVPSKNTSQIQVAEILIGQMFCSYLEDFFIKK
ncbi:MAG: SIS domain-containing protein, partial [Pseudomonadota bacterium]|nr:SIS domain-containing protein [Pseudomonadota bacterium]